MSSSASSEYAGDLELKTAWELLASDAKAQLVDVRTAAEWSFVGLPDLSSLAREPHRIEWQSYPDMQVNSNFVSDATEQLQAAGAGPHTSILFLCRSGARSRAAAAAMTRAGFHKAFNIARGFEGDLDGQGHRGRINGWKASGLPWRQT
jgi:rhodanese-related sulfurtransferase